MDLREEDDEQVADKSRVQTTEGGAMDETGEARVDLTEGRARTETWRTWSRRSQAGPRPRDP